MTDYAVARDAYKKAICESCPWNNGDTGMCPGETNLPNCIYATGLATELLSFDCIGVIASEQPEGFWINAAGRATFIYPSDLKGWRKLAEKVVKRKTPDEMAQTTHDNVRIIADQETGGLR